MNFRIGFGYDVHQLEEDLDFWLGGIKIDHSKGCVAHSDGDVLIHAICDAMLGAANLGDIGKLFPDNSPEFKNIDSKILLQRTNQAIKEAGYAIGNIDSTVCLQKPKIQYLIPQMKKVLSNVLSISVNDLSIKATTTEKLGFVGEEKGVSAYAVILLKQF